MHIKYPDTLPISKEKDRIIKALREHQTIIVAGDTGSGKTTQLPKMCLEAFPGSSLYIGCTQPRRIAATSVTSRVAEELGQLNHLVGYKIRFADKTSKSTRIKFMTDGILLAETRNDPDLAKYGVIIVDEAHERSLNIDFLLGYLKQLLPRRKDLRIIICSATIDTQSFAKHFNDAPILRVEGRSYPIDVSYMPPDQEDQREGLTPVDLCCRAVQRVFSTEPWGDILIFLPTEKDIKECCKMLRAQVAEAEVLPLFGRLSGKDQIRIFRPANKIKIVVATNVAETSITVPGIRIVIDSGLARISQYNVRAKTTALPISKISKASADQRKGRCGRIGPGHCIRLYAQGDYESRSEFSVPELQRANLAEVILQMISLRLGRPEAFPFVDPPKKNAINEGYRLLTELGAITSAGKLTKQGALMASLPIDPCISRVILEARKNHCLREITILASVLAIQDPRVRPAEEKNKADTVHRSFAHPKSDFLTYLNIWESFAAETAGQRSWGKLKKFCKKNYLSFQRMREWFDLHEQLDRLLRRRREFTVNTEPAGYEEIHKSLLPGFLRNLGRKTARKQYQGTHNTLLQIFPGSYQAGKRPQWILAADFIETNLLYAHTVAAIEPEWIETAGGSFCKYSWSEPRWSKKLGYVVAYESASLFGLLIRSGKQVNFAKRSSKNRAEARQIFISHALVAEEIKGNYAFLQKNSSLLQEITRTQSRLRTQKLLIDDTAIASFYDLRLGDKVLDEQSLKLFLKNSNRARDLFMRKKDLLRLPVDDNALLNYPESIEIQGLKIRIEYSFEPGSNRDGITYCLPQNAAASMVRDRFDWLVPGLMLEKLSFLIKGLPKAKRKRLIPIRQTVDQIWDDLDYGKGPLLSRLEQSIEKLFSVRVRRDEWKTDLPAHLLAKFSIFDDRGKIKASGTDLTALLADCSCQQQSITAPSLDSEGQKLVEIHSKQEFRDWNLPILPDKIATFTRDGQATGFLYPVLMIVREKGVVRLDFITDRQKAMSINRKGVVFLLTQRHRHQFKALEKQVKTSFSGPSVLFFLPQKKVQKEVVSMVLDFILAEILAPLPGSIPGQSIFAEKNAFLEQNGLYKTGQKTLELLLQTLRKRRKVEEKIEEAFNTYGAKIHRPDPKKDIFLEDLLTIFPQNYLNQEHSFPLEDCLRYLRGLEIRLERFIANPLKDEQKSQRVRPYLEEFASFQQGRDSGEFQQEDFLFYRRMLEEFKLQVFAPEVKTRLAVSAKKLDQHWQTILRGAR